MAGNIQNFAYKEQARLALLSMVLDETSAVSTPAQRDFCSAVAFSAGRLDVKSLQASRNLLQLVIAQIADCSFS